jgi:predicted transcriptional regulator
MPDPLRSRKGRTKLTVELPDDLLARLKQAAAEEERDVWRIVARAIRRDLEVPLAERQGLLMRMAKGLEEGTTKSRKKGKKGGAK